MANGYGRGGWASSDDYTFLSLVIILIGLAFGGWLLWNHHHAEVVGVLATLQLAKMSFIARFTDSYDELAALVAGARYETVSFDELLALLDRVGAFYRVPATILIVALGLVCLLGAPSGRYRRQLDLDGLVREQAKFHRAASAYKGWGLKLVALRDGDPRPADASLYVHEWAARYAADQRGQYDVDAARRALASQLGPVWRDPHLARPPARVMFAAFSLHLHNRREEALGLLGNLAEALAAEARQGQAGPASPLAVPASVLATADAFLREAVLTRPAAQIARRHGFETTALMGLLTAARLESGVLPPAQFNGLKLLDRSLWYALHALGFPGHGPGQNTNPNPRVEAIGARAHWEAERQAGCALCRPEIEQAEHAIRAALAQHQDRRQE